MRRAGWLLPLLYVLWSPVQADPQISEEAEWLSTMAFAAHQTDYSGVFVYQSGGNVEMSRITHVRDRNGEHERLESLGSKKRELIRSNSQVWLLSDGQKTRIGNRQLDRSFPALLPNQIAQLKENYSVYPESEVEIAGYHAHTIYFKPRDNLRYARKMWAHSDTGLLLKAEVLGDRSHIIEQYAFMQLKIKDGIDRSWIIPEGPKDSALVAAPLHGIEVLHETCDWQVDALPPGFKKVVEMHRAFHEGREPVIHMVFSDGLAGISVFIEKARGSSTINAGLSGQGAIHVYNRVAGGYLITVVGDVPPRTVIKVADSVRYAGQ